MRHCGPGVTRHTIGGYGAADGAATWPGHDVRKERGHEHDTTLPDIPLPSGIRSRFVEDINGLRMHVLEAGFETSGRPCVLLLHGFPELAFSWRKVMPALAEAGYHVIAPDQRGYGRTTGWDANYDGDLASFRLLNLVRDALGLVSAFGYRAVDAVVGHDFGSSVAAWCALLRPDVFRSVALMSAPFAGPPPLPFNTADAPPKPKREDPVHRELAALPRPRKHYQWYYSTREANADMHHAPQGVHDFLRAYYHHKSADWKDNKPYPLQIVVRERTGKTADLLRDGSRQEHGRDGGGGNAVGGGRSPPTNGCPTASLPSTAPNMRAPDSRAACNGIAAAPRAHSSAELADLVGPQHRRALLLHLGQAGLGHVSAPRRVRSDAVKRLHAHDRLSSGRRRRSLGAAGTARGGEPAVDRLSARKRARLIN